VWAELSRLTELTLTIWFFGYLCVGAEFTYIILYVHNQHLDVTAYSFLTQRPRYCHNCCVPGCIAKQYVNVMQLHVGVSLRLPVRYADQYNKQK
jgi:hypothetical protein